jgi:hypothetical protein
MTDTVRAIYPGSVVPRRSGAHGRIVGRGGQRFSAAVVLFFVFASTALALYDLHLLVRVLS